ncbi:hypothetical protein [Rhizobium sp. C4]|uniref:hypothetical protein n=1 Tax=Rhizobium sp. C4 TaxID=1349800 RepID=UPI001E3EB4DE|nr:hypothetical protein [Rhizobium sp. C4]MCD2175241.1 hypothetical protein [Rhizobium sp. C4]
MKFLIVVAGICVIVATLGAGFVGYTFYTKGRTEGLKAQCEELAKADPAAMSDLERVQAKSLADKCRG